MKIPLPHHKIPLLKYQLITQQHLALRLPAVPLGFPLRSNEQKWKDSVILKKSKQK